ncbi:hypothetical protein B0H17DRAFT_255212 [Mycena rosella]|uniref:CCHC-type domain-containing protein n=1 Tax=Mycena rosella TaxID=1033263 RepID=A0AAD7D0F7_MYCRO|nr:hypothetical protein B0H17DRAFT_255212 [Mycena rosella]
MALLIGISFRCGETGHALKVCPAPAKCFSCGQPMRSLFPSISPSYARHIPPLCSLPLPPTFFLPPSEFSLTDALALFLLSSISMPCSPVSPTSRRSLLLYYFRDPLSSSSSPSVLLRILPLQSLSHPNRPEGHTMKQCPTNAKAERAIPQPVSLAAAAAAAA